MPQESLRSKIATLKQDSEVAINGYTIKRKGVNWIVTKGDFYRRSFTEQQLGKLVDKLNSEVIQEVQIKQVRSRAIRKANKLALQLEKKTVRELEIAKALAEKEARLDEKLAAREARIQERANRPFRRNKFVLEVFNIIIQAAAYFAWFAYFFTNILEQHLGEYTLFVVLGLLGLSLVIYLLYVRQLGKRHRILNSITGFINLILVTAALSFYFGQLSFDSLAVEQLLPSLETAIAQIESISLIAFLFVKWVLTLIINKK